MANLRGRARHSVRAVGLAKIHPICGSLTSAARAERRALPEFDLGDTPSRRAQPALPHFSAGSERRAISFWILSTSAVWFRSWASGSIF